MKITIGGNLDPKMLPSLALYINYVLIITISTVSVTERAQWVFDQAESEDLLTISASDASAGSYSTLGTRLVDLQLFLQTLKLPYISVFGDEITCYRPDLPGLDPIRTFPVLKTTSIDGDAIPAIAFHTVEAASQLSDLKNDMAFHDTLLPVFTVKPVLE